MWGPGCQEPTLFKGLEVQPHSPTLRRDWRLLPVASDLTNPAWVMKAPQKPEKNRILESFRVDEPECISVPGPKLYGDKSALEPRPLYLHQAVDSYLVISFVIDWQSSK